MNTDECEPLNDYTDDPQRHEKCDQCPKHVQPPLNSQLAGKRPFKSRLP
jgi:hypothetical protein